MCMCVCERVDVGRWVRARACLRVCIYRPLDWWVGWSLCACACLCVCVCVCVCVCARAHLYNSSVTYSFPKKELTDRQRSNNCHQIGGVEETLSYFTRSVSIDRTHQVAMVAFHYQKEGSSMYLDFYVCMREPRCNKSTIFIFEK